jgi:2-polyprenyl-6-methoxyphenol hydroxylase-like FAD-dependent oxidoreductase
MSHRSIRDSNAENRSIWTATARRSPTAPLDHSAEADVCVVGAGIAGMTAAYLLAREGKSVIVMEKVRWIPARRSEHLRTCPMSWTRSTKQSRKCTAKPALGKQRQVIPLRFRKSKLSQNAKESTVSSEEWTAICFSQKEIRRALLKKNSRHAARLGCTSSGQRLLDEAHLDVSENKTGLPTATQVARTIREQIRTELSITASAGVAPNIRALELSMVERRFGR